MRRTEAIPGRILGSMIFLLSLSLPNVVVAQGGDGSLRGTVKDSQGGALPGVTVTATSDVLLSPNIGVTDGSGNYRLINLPPGTFTVTAELAGFSKFRCGRAATSRSTSRWKLARWPRRSRSRAIRRCSR